MSERLTNRRGREDQIESAEFEGTVKLTLEVGLENVIGVKVV